MTTKQIYQLAIDLGVKNDLRGQNIVKRKLNRVKQQYAELPQAKKEEFDQERLVNPFSDTRYFGRPDKKVNKVMAGIDIDVAELLVARELGGIDLVIAHHPVGPALAGLHEVMDLQVELMAKRAHQRGRKPDSHQDERGVTRHFAGQSQQGFGRGQEFGHGGNVRAHAFR